MRGIRYRKIKADTVSWSLSIFVVSFPGLFSFLGVYSGRKGVLLGLSIPAWVAIAPSVV